jgi:hypothetical protein
LGEKEIFDPFKEYYEEDDSENIKYFFIFYLRDKKTLITHGLDFYDNDLCYKRVVNNLEWSTKVLVFIN